NRVVVIQEPEKESVVLPESDEVKALFAMVEGMTLEPYQEELTATALMEAIPEPATIQSEKNMESLGVTELTLANGLKVVLKPTDFKNDEIIMRAFSPGGTSVYPDQDYLNADYAASIISESGVKDFSVTDLQKLLSGKNASAAPYISSTREGFRGNSTPKDLETMLQLVHLYFTQPRKDKESFMSFVNKNKALYQNLMSNPNYYYSDKVSRILSQNHPRGGGFPSAEDWEKIKLDRAYEIYQERFADASDFTFFFVGNFEVEKIKPLLARYLATLPGIGREESWEDLGIRPPEGMVNEKVIKGTDPQSRVTMVFHKKGAYSPENAYLMNSLADVLNIKLIEVLREEKGGVYGAGGNGSASKYPYEHYTFSIGFPCAPENVDDLSTTAVKLLKDLQENGPSEEDLKKVKETQRRIRLENLEKNSFWANALDQYYYYDLDPATMLDYNKRVDNLSAEAIQKFAKKYIDTDEYIKIVLYPEGFLEQ
ncbi:MAG: M16 family metallopeptidase, partial [Cyclobacteriaceae bacterium]